MGTAALGCPPGEARQGFEIDAANQTNGSYEPTMAAKVIGLIPMAHVARRAARGRLLSEIRNGRPR